MTRIILAVLAPALVALAIFAAPAQAYLNVGNAGGAACYWASTWVRPNFKATHPPDHPGSAYVCLGPIGGNYVRYGNEDVAVLVQDTGFYWAYWTWVHVIGNNYTAAVVGAWGYGEGRIR